MAHQRVDDVKNMILEDLERGKVRIFDGLVSNAALPILPEPIFVHSFVRCFAGLDQRPAWVAEWISIAGTPSTEVSIVDPVTGQEVFRVPPFLSTQAVLIRNSASTLSAVFDHTQNLSKSVPGYTSMQFMNNELAMKAQEALQHTDTTVHDRWAQIFSRYNIVQPGSQTQLLGQQPVEQDMFDYE